MVLLKIADILLFFIDYMHKIVIIIKIIFYNLNNRPLENSEPYGSNRVRFICRKLVIKKSR